MEDGLTLRNVRVCFTMMEIQNYQGWYENYNLPCHIDGDVVFLDGFLKIETRKGKHYVPLSAIEFIGPIETKEEICPDVQILGRRQENEERNI